MSESQGSQFAAGQTVFIGPARSGKTHQALDEYRRGLAEFSPGSCLWLSPTSRSSAAICSRLLEGGANGFFRPNVMTFERFAATILSHSEEGIRPVSALANRLLLRRIVDGLARDGRLPVFAEISRTSGFVETLASFISEIKRLEIWPDQLLKAFKARGARETDKEVHLLYESYQQELNDRGLYDAQGQFWTARTLIRDGSRQPFEHLRLIVVDGFTDFTSTQHEILHDLATTGDAQTRLILTLPGEENSQRPELFAKSAATLQRLRDDFGDSLQTHYVDRRETPAWQSMQHLESNLFGPPEKDTAKPAARIQLLEAAGEVAEIEEIARQIKQLLTLGDPNFVGTRVRPQDILVTLRSVDSQAVLISETFTRYGIPHFLESGLRVGETGFFRALLQVLALVEENWAYRRLLGVVTGNYFAPAGMEVEDRVALLKLIRALQTPSERDDLLASANGYLNWLERKTAARGERNRMAEALDESSDANEAAEVLPEDTSWTQRGLPDLEACRKAVDLIEKLSTATGALPQRATLAEWIAATGKMIEQLGLNRVFAVQRCTLDQQDAQAWQLLSRSLPALDASLSAGKAGDELHSGEAPTFDLAGFRRLLVDFGRMTRLDGQHDEVGNVRVLSAKSVRSLDAPYVFVAGLTERAFPAAERGDALYGESDNRQLREAGLPLADPDQRYSDELILFYEVVTRATKGILLSFPAFDDRAEPLLPSPFVLEIQRAFGAGQLVPRRPESLSPVPDDPPCCEDEFRLTAVSKALQRKPQDLIAWAATAGPERGQNVLTGLEVVANRGQRKGFGGWEGMLLGESIQQRFAREFNRNRTLSATDLESYASCPFAFFLQRVLRVEEVSDLRLEIDHLSRGRLLHDVLYRLQRQINAQHGGPTSPAEISQEEYDRIADETITQVLKENPTADALRGAMREIDRRLMVSWLTEYRDQHESYDAQKKGFTVPLKPAHLEVAFGLTDSDGDSLSTQEPFSLEYKGEEIRLRGRIDRIDRGRYGDQEVFSIIDFKSGRTRPTKKDRDDLKSRRLQLELYAMAAGQLLLRGQNALPWVSAFWFLAVDGIHNWRDFATVNKETQQLEPSQEWNSRRPHLLKHVFGMVRAMRRGQFPVHSAVDNCTSYCEFSTACRVNQIRSLEKAWNPPAK